MSTVTAASGKLVLVVDDEPDVRASLSLIVGMEGYATVTASHAGAALELIEKRIPDLVLTDFMMPWMNGRELLRQLKDRQDTRAVPTILMSGVSPGPPELWDAFLRKPMDIAELLDTIRRLLEARGSARRRRADA